MRLCPVSVVVAVLWFVSPAAARADDFAVVHDDVLKALGEGRSDDAFFNLGRAIKAATQANDGPRIGRLELFRAELDADHPAERTVEGARKAMQYLGGTPFYYLAALRYHVSGGQVALDGARLGAAALHAQEGKATLARVLASLSKEAPKAPGLALAPQIPPAPGDKGTPNPQRDAQRLAQIETSLTVALRKAVDEASAGATLKPGTLAALAAFATGRPLVASTSTSEEPVVPPGTPLLEGLKVRLDRALSDAEEHTIAAADSLGDARTAALARSKHADTLVRLSRVAEAIKVRRAAIGFYRERGSFGEILVEDHWLAEHELDRRAVEKARRETVFDIERHLSTLAGPARMAALAKQHADYQALVEAVAAASTPQLPQAQAPATSKRGKRSSVPADRGGPTSPDAASAALEAVELLRDRTAVDEVQLFGDGARRERLGGQWPELRRALDAAIHAHLERAEDGFGEAVSTTTAAVQRVADALSKAAGQKAPDAPGAIDAAKVVERLGFRTLLVYARLDAQRMAVVALGGRGTGRIQLLPFSAANESAWIEALATSLREGEDGWRDPASKLYAALIAPVEWALAPGIVIVPDGGLAAIPFAALLDDKGAFLRDRADISLLPSVRSLLQPRPAKLSVTGALLAGAARFSEHAFVPLAVGDREPSALKKTLDAAGRQSRLAGPTITADKLLAETGPFDIFHLVTRARPDGEDPALGVLALSTSLIPAFALAASPLRANLAVLDLASEASEALGAPKAAGSGVGQGEAAARGLMGLAAAVLAGPAATVLVSQSAEGGPSSTALLARFYERYAGGESPALALAGAQRDMGQKKLLQPLLLASGANPMADAARFVHPRFWAPFIVVGEP